MILKIGNFLFHYRNALFPLVYLLLVPPSRAILPDFRVAAVIGFLVAFSGQFIRAVTIGLEYIIRGGRNRQVYADKLVTGGMFAHSRNPLYLGNLLILFGVGIASNSVLFMAVGVPFFLFAYAAIIAAEEDYLHKKFGEEFLAYCARVNRLLPNLSGLGATLEGMRFNWRRLITAEYGSAYIWLAAVILVTLKNVVLAGDYSSERPLIWVLCVFFVLVTLGYAAARYLKKSGMFKQAAAT